VPGDLVSKATLKLAEELLDRFFRDAEGKAERKLDVYFTVEDMSVSFDKAEPALEYLASRGLLQLFDFESATLTDMGVEAILEDTDIKKLPKFQREWGGGASAAPAPAPAPAAAPQAAAPAPEPAAPAAPPPAQSNLPRPDRPRLTYIDGDGVPRTHHLEWRATAGRTDANDLHLADPRSSKKHAEFRYAGDKYVLKDLGSANGTMVNGQYIDMHPLQHGDEVIIGRTSILYECPLALAEPKGEPVVDDGAGAPAPAAPMPPPSVQAPEPPKPTDLRGPGERAPTGRKRRPSRRGPVRGDVEVKPVSSGSVKVVQGKPLPVVVPNEPSLEAQLVADEPKPKPPQNLFDDEATAAEQLDMGGAPPVAAPSDNLFVDDDRPTAAPPPMAPSDDLFGTGSPPPAVQPDDPLGLGTPADVVAAAPRAPSLGLDDGDQPTDAVPDDVRETAAELEQQPTPADEFDEKTPVGAHTGDGPRPPVPTPEQLAAADIIDDDDRTPVPPRSRFAQTLALLRDETEGADLPERDELLAAIDLLSRHQHVRSVLEQLDDA